MSLQFINAPDLVGHWINGQPDAGSGSRRGDVFNPAQGRVARQVALAARADVDRAVAAAKAAAVDWGSSAPQRRARVMFAFRDLVERYAKDIARLLSAEHGKTLPDALGEVQRGLEVIEFACGIPQLLKGQHSHGIGGGIDHWSQRMPLGVAAGITPFNFPLHGADVDGADGAGLRQCLCPQAFRARSVAFAVRRRTAA
jgi:malonate-semialdehyde dehydrogenase (acetylating)/methylmalonate-semialdehyde dehydrogenase